jgi:hypothetical protein
MALACGPSNLPDDQLLSSPHFRYHARAESVLDPTIVDRLEADRTELDGYLGIDSGVVDYYLFPSVEDRHATVGCDVECTQGRSIYTAIPFQEHELVHAFLADVNQPPRVFMEGMAQYFACRFPKTAYQVSPAAWPEIGAKSISRFDGRDILYSFGQRLISWMAQTGGTERLVAFYRSALLTTDAALFALQFERFWGRKLGVVAGELVDQRYAGSFCPCTAPPLPTDGSPTSFVAGQDYRTLDVAGPSRVELANDHPLITFPYACASAILDWNDDSDTWPAAPTATALTVARVGPGRYGVTAPSIGGETVTLHLTQRAQSDWSCHAAAANPIAIGDREVTAWVTPEFDGEETWFAFTLDKLTALDILSPETDFTICSSCDVECSFGFGVRTPGPVPLMPPASGPLLIKVRHIPGWPAANVGLRVRHWE